MQPKLNERRLVWMGMGLMAGLCLAYFWPHETAQAVMGDRDDRFAMCTVDVGFANPEAIFVLDFLTGRLQGAMLNQQSGTFTNFWARNIAADFQQQADAAAKAKYVFVPGRADLNNKGGTTTAAGVLYIGELTSGKVGCYRFSFKTSRTVMPLQTLEPFAYFPFREETRE
ncbi:MAG: hypothetical protein H7062_06590 [Candidatus Saccharimonas sp.]|nr:hypothetical protein [Planctomycetaceae bacterium]